MRTAAASAMTTGGYSRIPFHRGTRDLVAFSGLLPVATRPNLHQFRSLKPIDDRPPLRLALAPIRSAIVLARFVFRKTTTKTPFRDSKSLRDPPSVAPGVILEVDACRRSSHSDCVSSRRRRA